MLGTYKGTYSCAGQPDKNDYTFEVQVYPDPSIINKVAVSENSGESLTLCTVTGTNTFSQEHDVPGSSFSFKGEVNNDSLTITFRSDTQGGISNDCVFHGVRQ